MSELADKILDMNPELAESIGAKSREPTELEQRLEQREAAVREDVLNECVTVLRIAERIYSASFGAPNEEGHMSPYEAIRCAESFLKASNEWVASIAEKHGIARVNGQSS